VTLPREHIEAIRQTVADDVLSQLRNLYYDTALSANGNAFSSLRELVQTSHILLGTDYPFAPEAGSTPTKLAALPGLDEQDLQAIDGENALTLFPRLR
jgi:6-methylsalicylate decarboxylase